MVSTAIVSIRVIPGRSINGRGAKGTRALELCTSLIVGVHARSVVCGFSLLLPQYTLVCVDLCLL